MKFIYFIVALSTMLFSPSDKENGAIQETATTELPNSEEAKSTSEANHHDIQIELANIKAKLLTTSYSRTADTKLAKIELPFGKQGREVVYEVYESYVMHPTLAAKYPNIKTYHARRGDRAELYATLTIHNDKLSGQFIGEDLKKYEIQNVNGTNYRVSEVSANISQCDSDHHQLSNGDRLAIDNLVNHQRANSWPKNGSQFWPAAGKGDELRVVEYALSLTGAEANNRNITTMPDAVAHLANLANGLDFGMIRDHGMHFVLILDNDKLISIDVNDAYAGMTNGQVISSNPAIFLDLLGHENYDWGHAIHAAGGGLAGYSMCDAGNRALGTSLSSVGIMLHEHGHQFNIGHTTVWDQGNYVKRDAASSLGGSGLYYHSRTITQAHANTRNRNHCYDLIPSGNTPPCISNSVDGFSIPPNTPFKLENITATDPDANASLTYAYQSLDTGTEPDDHLVFTHKWPTAEGNVKYIPTLSSLVAGVDDPYSHLPFTERAVSVTCIVRDNQPICGGVNMTFESFNVVGTQAFDLHDLGNGATYFTTSAATIDLTWDVAGTTLAPFNVSDVRISLTTNGGITYDIELLASTPNDGSATITLPAGIVTDSASIMVEAIGNIFFDATKRFVILPSSTVDFALTTLDSSVVICSEASTQFNIFAQPIGNNTANIAYTFTGLPLGVLANMQNGNTQAIGNDTLHLSGLNTLSSGVYPFVVTGTVNGFSKEINLVLAKTASGTTSIGNYINFTANGQRLKYDLKSTMDFSGSYTLELWVNLNSASWHNLLIKSGTIKASINNEGTLVWESNALDGQHFVSKIDMGLVPNEWAHITVAFDGDKLHFYKNGYKLAESYLGTNFKYGINDNEFWLGSYIWYQSSNMKMDELRIWDQFRTAEQIRKDIHFPFNACQEDLIIYSQMNEGASPALTTITGVEGVIQHGGTFETSTIPAGTGAYHSTDGGNGLVDFTNTNLAINFNTNDLVPIAVSYIDGVPTQSTSVINGNNITIRNGYWIINRDDKSTTTNVEALYANLVFASTIDVSTNDEQFPIAFQLYRRNLHSNGTWEFVKNANSVNAITDKVTFQGVNQDGEYLVVKSASPVINATAIAPFSCEFSVVNELGSEHIIEISGFNLTAPIEITAPSGFEISESQGSGFQTSLSIVPINGAVSTTPIYYRINPTEVKTYSDYIHFSSVGAQSDSINVEINVVNLSTPIAGNAASFDGVGDRVEVEFNETTYEKFTVEFWLKPFELKNYNNQVGWNWGEWLFHTSQNGAVFAGINSGNNDRIITAANTIKINEWHHIAFSFDSLTMKLYVNGHLLEEKVATQMPNPFGRFLFGSWNGNSINGHLDEFRFWTDVRNEEEIRESMHHNVNILDKCDQDLEVYFQFETIENDTFKSVSNNYTGRIINDVETITSSGPFGNGASQELPEATSIDFTEVSSTIDLRNPVTNNKLTLSKMNVVPNTISGVSNNASLLDGGFFILHRRASEPPIDMDVTLTLDEVITNTNAKHYHLYARGEESDTDWMYISFADSVSVVDKKVIFKNVSQTGQLLVVENTDPFIRTSVSNLDFGKRVVDRITASKSFTLNAVNVLNSFVLKAPNGFELSLDNVTFQEDVSPIISDAEIVDQEIYVRFKPSAPQIYTGRFIVIENDGVEIDSFLVKGEGVLTDELHGKAIALSPGGNYARLYDVPVNNTNTFSISFWMKSNGNSEYWSGLVGNPNAGFQLNLLENNQLRFHYPGASHWQWNSGHVAEDNEWVHIAWVIAPNQVSIYMNGVPKTRQGTFDVITFDPTTWLLGRQNGSREFNGEIDELQFWNKTLTEAEVRQMMHLTLDGLDTSLAAYYQFNSTTDTLADYVGSSYGLVYGSAEKIASQAVVSRGTAVVKNVTNTGVISFDDGNEDSQVDLNFGQNPNGDVAVTKMKAIPHGELPSNTNLPDSCYWIIHNFGSNTLSNSEITLSLENSFLESTNPNHYNDLTRAFNDTTVWTTNNMASGINIPELTFSWTGETMQFVPNRNNVCDHTAHSDTVYVESCDSTQAGTVIDTIISGASNGCDSFVTTIITYIGQADETVNETTCVASEAGNVTTTIDLGNGCSYERTTITTYIGQADETVNETTCVASEAGNVMTTIDLGNGCSYERTTIITYIGQADETVNETTCVASEAGNVTTTIDLGNGCSFERTTITTYIGQANETINETTCVESEAGSETTTINLGNGCSYERTTITTYIGQANETINETTCVESEAGSATTTIDLGNGCSFERTTITTYIGQANETINETSCIESEAGSETTTIDLGNGCSYNRTTITTYIGQANETVNETTCVESEAGSETTTIDLGNGCSYDRTIITTYIGQANETVNETTCIESEAGSETTTINLGNGCSYERTTITTYIGQANETVNETSCIESEAGSVTTTIDLGNGCSYELTTITDYVGDGSQLVMITTCNIEEVDTVVTIETNGQNCTYELTTITTYIGQANETINETTCVESEAGSETATLTNAAGCEYNVTTITTLLPSYEISIERRTCNPNAVGVFVEELTTQQGCDSIVTTSIVYLPQPVASFIYKVDGLNVTFENTSTNSSTHTWFYGDNDVDFGGDIVTHQYSSAGTYESYLIASNRCGKDTMFQRIDITSTAIDLIAQIESSVLYPNPNNGTFTVELKGNGLNDNLNMVLFNVVGEVIEERNIYFSGYAKEAYVLENLPSGTYLLKISNKSNSLIKKIEIIK